MELKEMDLKEKINYMKSIGFSDIQLSAISGLKEKEIRNMRRKPVYKMVDTCAAEFDAKTPYYYSTYDFEDEVSVSSRKKVIIIGSGPIRIGQGIEFDYCTVHAISALREEGVEAIVVNNNPETISTDFDISDKLYFEPITFEDVMNVVEKESKNLLGVIVQFGGQTSINLANTLYENGVKILGTSPKDIDIAEDREKSEKFFEELNIKKASGGTGFSFLEVKEIANKIGYPVLVRPSYVLGGRAMEVVYDESHLEEYMAEAVKVSEDITKKHPILVDKFISNAVEVDVDAVCDRKNVLIGGIMEHIEEAGIHSGDSAAVIPPQSLNKDIVEKIKEYTREIALKLNTIGLINIQYAIKDNEIYIIEANPRGSRTVPFVSKAVNVPLAKIAAKVILGKKLEELVNDLDPMSSIKHISVKEVVFPFSKLPLVDPALGPEMKSTGEVMGIADTFGMAYYKSQIAAGTNLPLNGRVFISVRSENKDAVLPIAKKFLDLGFEIISTPGTSRYLSQNGVPNSKVMKISEGEPNIINLMKEKKIDLIINTPKIGRNPRKDGYIIRRLAVESNTPYITTISAAKASVSAIEELKKGEITVKAWNEYFKK